jgi:RecJ-like exonuclease
MDENVLPSKLLTTLYQAADTLRGHDFIHIFSHNDADGVSAAGILACTLQRLGKEYQVTLVPILNDNVFSEMQESLGDCMIMTDIGASYIDKLETIGRDVIVLDHHRSDLDSEKVVYANPHLYGIDGMTSGCGATLAFLLSVTIDEILSVDCRKTE